MPPLPQLRRREAAIRSFLSPRTRCSKLHLPLAERVVPAFSAAQVLQGSQVSESLVLEESLVSGLGVSGLGGVSGLRVSVGEGRSWIPACSHSVREYTYIETRIHINHTTSVRQQRGDVQRPGRL